jgi:hypothetical protein
VEVMMLDKNLSILYVEDDPGSRKVMRLMLQGVMALTHYLILEDSADFLSRAHAMTPPPALFLLDIHVDPHDGFQMLTMLRETPAFQNTPIIALTASVMNEEIQQLRDAGFNGVIAKPIDPDTFPAMIERILDGETIWTVVK